MIRIGYVGINTELPSASRTFRLSGYSEDRMLEVAHENILALESILAWNLSNRITLFRITSNLIPFGSHPVNSGAWKEAFRAEFQKTGAFIKENRMRVSLHPGQHTVLNTPNPASYASVLKDLEYHSALLDLMELSNEHVIVVHGGGGYGDKARFMRLLEERVKGLPSRISGRLVLENDEKVYNASDILAVCRNTGSRAVLDVFHHEVLPSFEGMPIRELILLVGQTWREGRQKIHYSDQAIGKRRGSHSESVCIDKFGRFLDRVGDLELDIMLEVKDKQASVLKLKQSFPWLE